MGTGGGVDLQPLTRAFPLKDFFDPGVLSLQLNRSFARSDREREILQSLSKGVLAKEIAAQLDIGFETVKTHLKSIYGKLHVRSRTEAVVKYLE